MSRKLLCVFNPLLLSTPPRAPWSKNTPSPRRGGGLRDSGGPPRKPPPPPAPPRHPPLPPPPAPLLGGGAPQLRPSPPRKDATELRQSDTILLTVLATATAVFTIWVDVI